MISAADIFKIFQASPVPVAIFDPHQAYQLVFSNKAYNTIFKLSEEESSGKTMSQLLPPDGKVKPVKLLSILEKSFVQVFETGRADELTNIVLDSDENPSGRVFQIENSPLIENEKVKYIIQSLIEVGPTNESSLMVDEKLSIDENRNELLEVILKNLPIGIAVNRINDGKATLVNRQFSQIYGWKEGDLVDIESFFEKVYPDPAYRERILKKVMNDINSGDAAKMEWENIEVTTSTGAKRIINAKNIPVSDHNLMISTVVDMTKQARQSEEIQRAKVNQEALINATSDLIWSVNSECNLIAANRAFLEVLKHSTGRDLREGDSVQDNSFGEEANLKWAAYYKKALLGQSYKVNESFFNTSKNHIEFSEVTFNPIVNDLGEISGVACYSKDTTSEMLMLEALEKTKVELQTIMDSSLDVICTIDKGGKFVRVSAAAQKIWGYTGEELSGLEFINLVYHEDRSRTIEVAEKIMAGNDVTNFENQYVRKDGTLVPIVWSVRWDQKEQMMFCVARDATEKKRVEQELITSEKRYRSLIENGADAIIILEATGKPKYVSESVFKILGYSEAEILGQELSAFLHPDDIEEVFNKMSESLARPGESISGYTARIRHKNGSWRWMEATLTNMLDDPIINGIVDNFRDVTERKETELENNLIINNTQEAFIFVNDDLRIVSFNDQFKELYFDLFNVTIKKGDSILEYAQPERRNITAKIYARVLKGFEENSEIYVQHPKSGDKQVYWITFKPARDQQGKIIGAFVTAKDITYKQLELDQSIALEEKYRVLFQSSPLPKFVYDLQSYDILDVNETAIDHYGYSREEFLKQTMFDIWSKSIAESMIEKHSRIDAGKRVINFGIVLNLKKNGELIQSEVSGHKFIFEGRESLLAAFNDVTERENAFKRLKENETKLLAAQSIAKVGYWQSFPEQDGLYWSDEVFNIWGLDKESFNLNYKSHFDTIHPDDRDEFNRSRDRAFKGGKQHDVEHRIILPDGSIKWVHALGNISRNENGEILIFEGTVQDITKDKVAIELLLTSEARQRAILESQTSYIVRTDLAGSYSFVNRKFLEDFGWLYESIDIIGQPSLSSILEYHHGRVVETVEKCLANLNTVFQVALDKPRKNSVSVRTTLWDFICLTDSKGFPTELQCVGIDISDWKKAQEDLEISNARYKYVTRATSEAIWDWDLIADQVYWGEGFHTLLGYDLNDLENWRTFWEDNVHPQDLERVQKETGTHIKNNTETWSQEYRFKLADGQYANVLDKVILIKNDVGEPKKMVGAIRDITSQKISEMKKQLLSETSQLFSNPDQPLSETLNFVLRHVLHYAEFNLGEIWLVSTDEKEIKLTARVTKEEKTNIFYEGLETITFLLGEGLPGKVWRERKMLIWDNIDKNRKFLRRNAAAKANLKTAVGLPLEYNSQIIGVLLMAYSGKSDDLQLPATFQDGFCSHLSAEIKRKRLDQELQQIFSFAPDVIAVLGADGFFKKINPAACQLLEYTEGELLRLPFIEIIHPEDREKTLEEINKNQKQLSTFYFENRYLTKSGRVIWLAWTNTPSLEEGLIFSVAKDITEKKNLEVLLEKSNSLAEIGSWEVDVQTREIYWSPETKNIHEVDLNFAPDLNTALSFYPKAFDREAIAKAVELGVKDGASWDKELEITTAKGNRRWIRSIGDAEFVNGRCIKLYGSFQNITAQKLAEQELLKIYTEKNSILESIADGFLAVDKNYKITYFNKKAEELLDKTQNEALGITLWDAFGNDMRSETKESYRKALVSNLVLSFEDYYRSSNKWYEINVYPTADGLSVFFRNITDRKVTELQIKDLNKVLHTKVKELAVSNSELEQFAYVASHDLQEPLRMISSFLSQLQKKYDNQLDQKAQQYIEFAVDGAKRMRQIILDLLDFSRVGRLNEKSELVDLNRVIDEIIIDYRREMEDNNILFIINDLPTILAPKASIQQLFQNLISNGIKYQSPGSKPFIQIGCKDSGVYWHFTVTDNGIGISPDYFEKIFIIFQRLHTKEQYSGTGMGLAICRKIVENWNGKLWVESDGQNGSIFKFTVPKELN